MSTPIDTSRARSRRPRRFLNWKVVLGVGLSAALLYYAFRDIDFHEVLTELRHADPLLFLAAVAAATSLFLVRAWRWRPILQPVKPGTAFRPRFACVTIGFMGNNLLPARMGEFARAYALSRLERLPVTATLGSLVIERLFDGFTMLAFLIVAVASPGFPEVGQIAGQNLGALATTLAAAFAAASGLLLVMTIWPARTVRGLEFAASRTLPASLRRPVVDALEAFLRGVGAIRSPGLVIRTALWSVLLWTLGALSFWLGFLAFGIHVPFAAAAFLQSIVALAVSLPSAPGFFGPFEMAVRIGLVDVFGVEASKAVGFAIGFHIGGFVPVTAIGLYYVWRLGISWREVERSEEVVEDAIERNTGVHPVDGAIPGERPAAERNDTGTAGSAGQGGVP